VSDFLEDEKTMARMPTNTGQNQIMIDNTRDRLAEVIGEARTIANECKHLNIAVAELKESRKGQGARLGTVEKNLAAEIARAEQLMATQIARVETLLASQIARVESMLATAMVDIKENTKLSNKVWGIITVLVFGGGAAGATAMKLIGG